MEQAIDDLKKIYLNTMTPVSYEEGLIEVYERVKQERHFPYGKFFLTLSLLFIVVGSFFGVALASTPNSPLYPVKQATEAAIKNLTDKSPEIKIGGNTILKITKKPTATPTLKPTFTPPMNKPTTPPGQIISEQKKKAAPSKAVQGISVEKPTITTQKEAPPQINKAQDGNRNIPNQDSEKNNKGKK